MTSSNNLTPTNAQEALALRQTNVSNPSIIHTKPSKHSITASEDYYSLSSGSSTTTVLAADDRGRSTNAIHRYTTPPSRYRTPLQSRDQLPSQSQLDLAGGRSSGDASDEATDAEPRRTPMRGEGKRRSMSSSESAAFAGSSVAAPHAAALREGGVRRKPIPSTVMESSDKSPRSQEYIDPAAARSSVARDIDREQSPTTPGHDDTPFLRFALDQLTRDEEVRGSRRYPGDAPAEPHLWVPVGTTGVQPQQANVVEQRSTREPTDDNTRQANVVEQRSTREPTDDNHNHGIALVAAGIAALGVGAAAAGAAYTMRDRGTEQPLPPSQQWPNPSRQFDERQFDEPPPRNPRHTNHRSLDQNQGPDLFIPVRNEDQQQERLNFIPGVLRLLPLLLFIILLVVLLALLLLSAIWSLTHQGIFSYGSFGNGTYFTLEYLPNILGMVLLIWLTQIEVAVYRVAPFIAMSSPSPRSWEEGAKLPLYPKSWLLPFLGHFRAGQAVVGIFMLVSWLQIWTIPLLASSFNVHWYGPPDSGNWRWVATTAVIWVVIIFYIILLISVIILMVWLRGRTTGLLWDPRSLADQVVLLQSSNALSLSRHDEIRHEPARLSYWRRSKGGMNEVFHTYGIADKPARRYSLEDGRILEKEPLQADARMEPKSRFSDFEDVEMGHEQRHSREKMLPKRPNRSRSSSKSSNSSQGGTRSGGRAVPWFLSTSAALLWIIVAVVLIVAFLVVSYLPATRVSRGFAPMVSAPVSDQGYSSTNFLYSFMPAVLAMICFLGLLDIDYAYRRLQPYIALANPNGEFAEKSLLLSYTADLPFLVTASAAVNGHYRVAGLSFASMLAAVLPILGGGCFWAQFSVPQQSIRIYAHMPAYYALTFFVVVYAIAIMVFVFPGRKVRAANAALPRGNYATRWTDIISAVRGSRMLDEIHFRGPVSKVDLVTRLLSAAPRSGIGRSQEAAAGSKVSLADSVRGFGNARQAADAEPGAGEVPRYALAEYVGRDGGHYTGIDRSRS
ncbi:hypothetical protein LTR37_012256 [Vermiconidia calcicola]|uniref:Uncharacterized protein n=1 Tax=Vermiconidia calcicola TaxID=1690605 RepID=A0ACC3MZU0_9PEZI|nr:hypothetical protein LTR37_012256 [Vermiconidia calcicola]